MTYVYPACFGRNEDGSYTITYPDLPGCISEGRDLANALAMASKALSQWMAYLIDEKQPLPTPSDLSQLTAGENEVLSLVAVDVRDNRAVRRTVSLPAWMDAEASKAGLSLSRVLQDALEARLDAR